MRWTAGRKRLWHFSISRKWRLRACACIVCMSCRLSGRGSEGIVGQGFLAEPSWDPDLSNLQLDLWASIFLLGTFQTHVQSVVVWSRYRTTVQDSWQITTLVQLQGLLSQCDASSQWKIGYRFIRVISAKASMQWHGQKDQVLTVDACLTLAPGNLSGDTMWKVLRGRCDEKDLSQIGFLWLRVLRRINRKSIWEGRTDGLGNPLNWFCVISPWRSLCGVTDWYRHIPSAKFYATKSGKN